MRYLFGYLKVLITGYSPERFLNLCKNKKIDLWELRPVPQGYEMYMHISDFRKLKPLLKKTQTKVLILERYGLPFFLHKHRKRKIFGAGITAAVLLIYGMTFFIWNIDCRGNTYITDEVLLEYLESKNIYHGMQKRRVNCEQIGKYIRKYFDEIIWVSVSLDGTCLTIDVKENTDTFLIRPETEAIETSDLVSDKNGTIISMVTRSGMPQKQTGDIVKEGEVLVSGTLDIRNDVGEVVESHYVKADADVYIERSEIYHNAISKKYQKKEYTKKKRTIFYLRIGKWQFGFGVPKHSFDTYEVEGTTKQLKIGKNFALPITISQKKIREYTSEIHIYSEDELCTKLNAEFDQFCKNLEETGVHILEKKLTIHTEDRRIKSIGFLKLREAIGVHRKIIDLQ